MIAKSQVKIGGVTFVFEFDGEEKLAMHKAIAVASIPTYCNVCQKKDTQDNFHLTTSRDKEGNTYINLKHNECGGRVKLGEYKQKGYFWHRDFEVYKGAKTAPKEEEAEDQEPA